jgi:prolyl oligopeptidase
MKRLALLVLFSCGEPPLPVSPPIASTADAAAAADVDASPQPAIANRFGYPATKIAPVTETIHGVSITDDYRWLENGKSDEVKKWLADQDAFARARLKGLPDRDAIAERLRELFYVEAHGIPTKAGNRYFYAKRDAGKEKWIVYFREGKTGKEKVLLDPNQWSKDGSVALGRWNESLDGRFVAYLKKQNNSDEATLYVMDVAAGKNTGDVIEGAKYASPSWTPRGDGFYYTWLPTDPAIPVADRPGYQEVRFHKLGTDAKNDKVVRGKTGDPKTFQYAEISRDGHFLILSIEHGWSATDVLYKDLRRGEPKDWKTLVQGRPFKYSVTAYKDRFYVKTDDGAPHGRIFKIDPNKPDRGEWKEIVPESKTATLDGWNVVGDRLSIAWLEDVKTRLETRDLDGKVQNEIKLPTIGSASVVNGNPEEDVGWYSFTSFTYPSEIYEVSMKTGAQSLFYKLKVPVDPTKLAVEQDFATSKDGTKVPYFIVRPKDFTKDGTAPLLLYGYGGFLGTQKPGFTSSMFPWLERGGVYVVANLRGGGEYGEDWHKAGMRHKKQNVFDDLFAITEKLVADKISSPQKIAVRGASNGGLLVAAAIVQRPDLYRVGLCGVPLIDMVRYHLFGSGKTWIEEYGSADDPEDFKAIYAYSPYQHIRPGTRYPSLLLLSADSDDRVDPMHAWKFAAKMQASSTGGIVLLRIEKNAGHGGADLVRANVEKTADELAFALSEIAKPN